MFSRVSSILPMSQMNMFAHSQACQNDRHIKVTLKQVTYITLTHECILSKIGPYEPYIKFMDQIEGTNEIG